MKAPVHIDSHLLTGTPPGRKDKLALFYKGTDFNYEVLPSWANHLPKAFPSNITALGVRISTHEFSRETAFRSHSASCLSLSEALIVQWFSSIPGKEAREWSLFLMSLSFLIIKQGRSHYHITKSLLPPHTLPSLPYHARLLPRNGISILSLFPMFPPSPYPSASITSAPCPVSTRMTDCTFDLLPNVPIFDHRLVKRKACECLGSMASFSLSDLTKRSCSVTLWWIWAYNVPICCLCSFIFVP